MAREGGWRDLRDGRGRAATVNRQLPEGHHPGKPDRSCPAGRGGVFSRSREFPGRGGGSPGGRNPHFVVAGRWLAAGSWWSGWLAGRLCVASRSGRCGGSCVRGWWLGVGGFAGLGVGRPARRGWGALRLASCRGRCGGFWVRGWLVGGCRGWGSGSRWLAGAGGCRVLRLASCRVVSWSARRILGSWLVSWGLPGWRSGSGGSPAPGCVPAG